MDEVRVWRTARTAQQIAYDMRHRLLGTESGLAGLLVLRRGLRHNRGRFVCKRQ